MLIATLGLAALFAFVVGDPLLSWLGVSGGGPQRENPIVATWNGGQLRRSDLDRHSQLRYACRAFLNEARQMGASITGEPPRVPLLIGQITDSGTIDTLLLAQQAQEIGFVVTDPMINRYLDQLTQSRVEGSELTALLRNFRSERFAVNPSLLFEVMRTEMLAHEYVRTHQISGMTGMPTDRWNSWKQLNDYIQLEIVPVAVESFLGEVRDPSDSELQDYYDKYRGQVKQPAVIANTELETPDPGFKAPRKVAMEFIKADFDVFVTRIADEVTEEQIAKYYEEHKEEFIRVELEEDGDLEEDSDASATPDTPTSNTPAPESTEEPDDSIDGSSSVRRDSPFLLTSLAEDKTEDNAKTEGDGEQPPAPRPDETRPDETEAPESTEESSDTEGSDSEDSGEGDQGSTVDDNSEEPEYQPLHEVTDEIRKRIAQSKAAGQIEEAMSEPMQVMRDYAARRAAWEAKQAALAPAEESSEEKPEENSDEPTGKQPDQTPPVPPSLAELAEKHGLTFAKTELVPFLKLRETDIGQCVVIQTRNNVAAVAFQQPSKYKPYLAIDMDFNRHLVWKFDEAPAYEVPLDTIRDEVALAWKMPEARKLAMKKAEELATEATERGQTLQELFAESDRHSVTETDPFARFTIGSAFQEQARFRLSEVDGVDGAGPDFMSKVFELQEGDVAVATNHAETFAYVVRLAGREKTRSELHEDFMRSVYPGDRFSQAIYQRIEQENGRRALTSLIQQTRQTLSLVRSGE